MSRAAPLSQAERRIALALLEVACGRLVDATATEAATAVRATAADLSRDRLLRVVPLLVLCALDGRPDRRGWLEELRGRLEGRAVERQLSKELSVPAADGLEVSGRVVALRPWSGSPPPDGVA